MFGAVKTVLACEAAVETVAPCPAGTAPFPVSAFVLDAAAQAQVEAALGPVAFSESSAFWAIAFVSVIALWSLTQIFSHTRRAIR